MANKKTSDLTELAVVAASGDYFVVLDVSDTTDSAEGTLKKISKANLLGGTNVSQVVGTTESQTLANKTLTSPTINNPVVTGGTYDTPVITTPDIDLGSDATGDMYYRDSSSAVERLALGAAEAILSSNGTIPAWITSRFYVGFTTYDLSTASGTQAITGVGFKPKAVIFLAVINNTTQWSLGFDDGNTSRGIGGIGSGTNIQDNNGSDALHIRVDGSNHQSGYITTFGSDGFTITWTRIGSPTGTVQIKYLAFR